MDFGICWGSWDQFPTYTKGLYLNFREVNSYVGIYDCVGLDAPNPHLVQGSTELSG